MIFSSPSLSFLLTKKHSLTGMFVHFTELSALDKLVLLIIVLLEQLAENLSMKLLQYSSVRFFVGVELFAHFVVIVLSSLLAEGTVSSLALFLVCAFSALFFIGERTKKMKKQ